MSEWVEYTLGDLCVLIGGGTPKTNKSEYWNGDIPWLSVSDFNNGRKYCYDAEKKITELGLLESSTKILRKGQIIISARGTVGIIAMIGKDMAFNQSNYGITAVESLTTNDFLYYLLKFCVPNLLNASYGAVFDTITKNTFNQIQIDLPPLQEQKAIAAVLSSLDDKIDYLHRQNQTLEAMAETLFRQWFVEEAGEDWEEKALGELLVLKGGTTPSTEKPEYWDGQVNWSTPKDLTSNKGPFIFQTERKISDLGLQKISSGLLPIGTLLLSSRAPIGYLAITQIPLAINQGYIAIEGIRPITNTFMYFWCKANMETIENAGNGSVFQEISKSTFKELTLKVPSIIKLEQFEKTIEGYMDKIKNNCIQIQTLTTLRDTLLPKLMSGEVRVKIG